MVEESYRTDPDTTFQAVKRICQKAPLRIVRVDEKVRRVIVSTLPSLFSWGETIEIIVQPAGGGSMVNVESKAKLFFNITAAGNIERNKRLILQRLGEEITSGT